MSYEDEPLRCLRLLRERKKEVVESLAAGAVSAKNVQGGYREVTGRLAGLDIAIEIIQEVFAGWLPDDPRKPATPDKPKPGYF